MEHIKIVTTITQTNKKRLTRNIYIRKITTSGVTSTNKSIIWKNI